MDKDSVFSTWPSEEEMEENMLYIQKAPLRRQKAKIDLAGWAKTIAAAEELDYSPPPSTPTFGFSTPEASPVHNSLALPHGLNDVEGDSSDSCSVSTDSHGSKRLSHGRKFFLDFFFGLPSLKSVEYVFYYCT